MGLLGRLQSNDLSAMFVGYHGKQHGVHFGFEGHFNELDDDTFKQSTLPR